MGLVKRTYVDGETVITAENLNAIQDAIIENEEDIATKGTYSKPSGGIPKTDLASSVQDSLDAADTAYQKPSGGIPSTDMTSAVQTSLEKADTALQSSDIDNTLSVTGKAADAKKTGDEISDVRNTLNQLKTDTFGSINLSGTNTTGTPIQSGTYFYNNGVLVRAYRTISAGAQINLNSNAYVVTGGALNSAVILDYIEPAFTNGIATYDMSTRLAARGLTVIDKAICQFNSGSALTSPIIRACDVSGATLTITTNTNTYSVSAVGVYVFYCGH